MKLLRLALVATTLLATACGSDDPSTIVGGGNNGSVEARLAGTLTVPTFAASEPNVPVVVSVTSSLQEQVSGGKCADLVQARAVTGSTWTDVSATGVVCSTIAILLAPGQSVQINGFADDDKLRAVAGASASNVVVRVRHTLNGAGGAYVMQSNEVTIAVP